MVPLSNEIARPKKTPVKLCFFYYNKKNLGTLLELAMPLSIFKVNVYQSYNIYRTVKKIKEIQNMIFKGIAKFKTNVSMLSKWTSSWLNCFALVLFQNTSSKETTLIKKKSLILFKGKGSWCHCSVLFFFENQLMYLNSLNTFQRFVVWVFCFQLLFIIWISREKICILKKMLVLFQGTGSCFNCFALVFVENHSLF